ncbi:tyrosine-protein phosphatase [Aquibium sp. LZ166]|uniref:Tyrosine-protein phosphatase n=1 Tax=Aquibium pacificus TaxID=3153579 RepID=A0ABV3SRU5_9HYPH
MAAFVTETGGEAISFRRLVAFDGVANFRDLGGYMTAASRSVRWGRVYRSSALDKMTEDDGSLFLSLGIRTICDLRSAREREQAPTMLPPACKADIHPMEIVSSAGHRLKDLVASESPTTEAYRAIMVDGYRSYVREHAEQFRRLFELLGDEGSYPLLFHCAAGKDRTGVAAALLLAVLGVGRDEIFDDYLLTNSHWHGNSPFARSAPPDLLPTIISAHRSYLSAALDAIGEDHDSIEQFCDARLGLGAAAVDRLRQLMLEPQTRSPTMSNQRG